jgi:hypothetical protein
MGTRGDSRCVGALGFLSQGANWIKSPAQRDCIWGCGSRAAMGGRRAAGCHTAPAFVFRFLVRRPSCYESSCWKLYSNLSFHVRPDWDCIRFAGVGVHDVCALAL